MLMQELVILELNVNKCLMANIYEINFRVTFPCTCFAKLYLKYILQGLGVEKSKPKLVRLGGVV